MDPFQGIFAIALSGYLKAIHRKITNHDIAVHGIVVNNQQRIRSWNHEIASP
jgi:hypothetical protein